MKFTITYILFGCMFIVLFGSYLNGPALTGNLDRTGSPLGGGKFCGECHQDRAYEPSLSIQLLDNGVHTDFYEPGKTYQLVIDMNHTGVPGGYGVQAVAIDTAKLNAGKFSNTPANTQITELNGIDFFEHGKLVSRLPFNLDWTAPPTKRGRVIIYAAALAADGNRANTGDGASFIELKLDEKTSSTSDIAGSISEVQILQNPIIDMLNVNLQAEKRETVQLRLIDVSGKPVIEKTNQLTLGDNFINMETGNINKGIYFLQISTGDQVRTEKVMKL